MGRKKKSSSDSSAIWWILLILVASTFGWLVWKNAQPKSAAAPGSSQSTNKLDFARATNLLHWLGTNLSSLSQPPPFTNLTFSNTTTPRITNRLVTIRTNPPLTVPSPAPSVSTTTLTNAPAAPLGTERPVRDILEAQIALARLAISAGPIDGLSGLQTRAAIRAFQKQRRLRETGDLDFATRQALVIAEPVYSKFIVTSNDIARLRPVPDTWLEKSEAESLDYESLLELIAERHQSSHNLIRSLNPALPWTNSAAIAPNTSVVAPNVTRSLAKPRAAFIRIQLAAKTLQVYDADTNLLAHFPCSIAQRVEKRPVGVLYVAKAAENPNYSFDPDIFPESAEAQEIGRKLIIPPGPNNPVGTAWIGLDRPGYGIHGTPRPDQVGRTESHGCFRLANWNAEYLLKISWAGMPIYVEQ